MNVLFGKVDPAIRKREVSGKISIFYFEHFLLRLEFCDVAVRVLESAKYIGIETQFREGIVCVRSQDASDIFIPLIVSDPTEVG